MIRTTTNRAELEVLTCEADMEVATVGVYTDYLETHITVVEYAPFAVWVIVRSGGETLFATLFESVRSAEDFADELAASGTFGVDLEWCVA